MRFPRLTLAVTALSAALALTACSGDGGDDESSQSPSSEASESATIYPLDQCQADVKVTGALKASWKGDAQATPSGDATVYQTTDGKKASVVATTEAGDVAASVVVTLKGSSHTAQAKGLEITESGGGAEVRATVQVAKGEQAKVAATFTCDQE